MNRHPTSIASCAPFAAAFLLTAAAVYCQESTPPLAKVTLSGREGDLVAGAGNKERYFVLEVDAKTKVRVLTKQDITLLPKELLEKHRKLAADFAGKVQLMIQKKDYDNLPKEEKAFKEASDEMLQYLGHWAVDGTLTQVDDHLQIDGRLRLFAYDGADKALGKGKTLVQGQAKQLKDKDDKTSLAIENGAHPILVIGKAAEEYAAAKGSLRIYGVLRSGAKGESPVLEAERIEVVK